MIIVRTPLRISFVGGGSDLKAFYEKYPGGVISTAIDKYVFVIVKERFDDEIYINYSKKECVSQVSDIQHDLVREAMKKTGIENGVEITTLADIPSSGSGLGSSSSITVALLHAFYNRQNILVTAEQLAQEACEIEIDILGKPIGKQDQYAAAYGNLNMFTFQSDGAVNRHPVETQNSFFRKFSSELLLYFTGITRSADAILSEQTKNTFKTQKAEIMQQMVGLVEPFKTAVEEGDSEEAGRLLDQNWQLKQTMASGISNIQIEAMYQKAKAAGALGGKVCGAGGGGFLLLMVPREKQSSVFEAMAEYRELPFMLERGGSKVTFDDRRYSSK
ncbi:D-glycero-alpha-D-manno-heptose-7-phosphate kinase [Desulfatibacillum alkenivorans DSM 16219]|jgi:D-glycero-alpha-D-manno-heptose-7-phosphate kinase|uniref:D-glycero-alpha-D-manno-heptose-7-phosphate kinase n=1 Tax=Desulfatibacillum alkenivorans DSM 16219 TaxID=1121393 RepID=A0A1M6UF57_9BACT|nr:GHMP kinase [Desulfatibacillum alkenivorans]SHK67688.1 D-glycero-alpha-D-manno-heptose-7-phosphate kinase [Desulfatibacillum alkenivorans DSM 16219]